MFIALDGGDGAGKGVQIEFLKRWLAERGLDFVFVRDPGDTSLGDIIRSLLLKNSAIDICPLAEAALFMASRAQLVQEIIEPALETGKVVLVDRYLLSTVVYQGYANDATEEEINKSALAESLKNLTPGQIIADKKHVWAGTATCPLEILAVKPQGKKEMRAADWARGARISEGACFG